MIKSSWYCKAIVSIALLVAIAVPATAADTQQAVEQATHSAQAWLKLVDDGQYKESWEQTSNYFKDHVPAQRFEDETSVVRKPLGSVLSRTLKRAQYATALPGAPDGQYVVIQYDTSFQHKKSAVETITPMVDSDGKWRVSGYYIR